MSKRAPEPVSLMELYKPKIRQNNCYQAESTQEEGCRKGKRMGKDGKKMQKMKAGEESEKENKKANKAYKCSKKK